MKTTTPKLRGQSAVILQQFARQCALSVAHLWDAPDIVLEYLVTGAAALRCKTRDCAAAAYEKHNAASNAVACAAAGAAYDAAARFIETDGGSEAKALGAFEEALSAVSYGNTHPDSNAKIAARIRRRVRHARKLCALLN